jgi:hypothetical protein
VILDQSDECGKGRGISWIGGEIEDALEQTLVFIVQVVVLKTPTNLLIVFVVSLQTTSINTFQQHAYGLHMHVVRN